MSPSLRVPVMLALVALAACDRRRGERERSVDPPASPGEAVGTTTLTGASWVANDAAIDRIVAARCARELTCKNVGAGRPFASDQVCAREIGKRLGAELGAEECPAGIDGTELDGCLAAIRGESCVSPIDAIARLAACRVGALCQRTELPMPPH